MTIYSCGFTDDGIGHNCCKAVDRLEKFVDYLYSLSVIGKLDEQSVGILIQLGNWVKNGDDKLAPNLIKKIMDGEK